MSSRSLFNIIIKIFGLFLLKEALSISSNILSSALMLVTDDAKLYLVTCIMPFFVYSGTAYVFLFHSDWLVRKLKLTKDIDEYIETNIHRTVILYIAIIILGGYILVDEMPETCQYLFYYYRDKVYAADLPAQFRPALTISVSKIIIALLIIRYSKSITLVIDKNRK